MIVTVPEQTCQSNRTLADRLGPSCIGPRSDIKASRHLFRGEACYIIHDPVSFQSHRLSVRDYEIFCSLDSKQTLAESFAQLVESGKLHEDSETAFYEYILRLQSLNLLNLPIANGKSLFERFKMIEARTRKNSLINAVMYLKIPLVNPDAFLDRTIRFMGLFYTPAFFVAWLVAISVSIGIVIQRWSDFVEPMSDLLAVRNLPFLWLSLIGLKVWHEFGHAYACKKFGGKVPDMGALFFVMTPCAYVDASAAWSFPRKLHRIIVSLGGMYFESMAACVAVFVWALTGNGFVHSAAHHIVVLSTLVTLLFNANPLMRFDGYYVLSDAVGIPNLRSTATAELVRILKQVLLGIRSKSAARTLLSRLILVVYGVSSSIYKTGLIIGISMMIAQKFLLVGLWLGGMQLFNVARSLLVSTLTYLWRSPEISSGRRPLAVVYSLVILAGIPSALLFVPVPGRVAARGVLSSEEVRSVRAGGSGFLKEVNATAGQTVEVGESLFSLQNPDVDSQLRIATAQIGVLQQRMIVERSVDRQAATASFQQMNQLNRQLELARQRRDALVVRAESRGRVARCIGDHSTGQYIQEGDELALLMDGRRVIRGLITAEEFTSSQLQEGSAVACQFRALPGSTFHGTVRRLNPAGSDVIAYDTLTHLAGGDIPVNPETMETLEPYFEFVVVLNEDPPADLVYGSSAVVRISRAYESLGACVVRKTRVFLSQLAKNG